MQIKEIVEKCREFKIYQQRIASDNYAELVMYVDEIYKWSLIFNELFGDPASPAGMNPTAEDLKLTKDYGGIFTDQTLYKKELPECTLLAMLWPWQDGKRVTIKLVSIPK